MSGTYEGSASAGQPTKLLHDAFWRYADATGHRWTIKIAPVSFHGGASSPASTEVVRLELSAGDARALAVALNAAAEHSKGEGVRLRRGDMIDTLDIASRLHVRPSTIRGWLTRSGPKGNPFPPPDQRYHGRGYWQKTTVDAWVAKQKRLRAAGRQRQSQQGKRSS